MFYPTWDKSFLFSTLTMLHSFGCVKAPDRNIALLLKCLRKTPCLRFFLAPFVDVFFIVSHDLFIINFRVSPETMETPGKTPTISHWSVPLPPRCASQTEHEGHVLHGGILHGARWIYDKVLPHLREGPTGRGRKGTVGPKFWWRKWWFLYHQKWGFHQENCD